MIPSEPTPQTINQTPSNSLSTNDSATLNSLPSDLASLLNRYSHIFTSLHSLPPHRPHDHHIHLQPDSTPVNIKPYRYPYFQKKAMTTMIADMLKDGIIQPSTSPHSSLVLLVKKKDGDRNRF
jgi:hypothetical protein